MKTIADFLTRHGFIVATSVAMFVHSTWSFNVVFTGLQQPHEPIPFVLWVLPGALIAIAIDFGQIQTSARLVKSRGMQAVALGFTFTMLALAGYYLQWFHLIHHMPALALGAGISPNAQASATSLRDAAVWIIPALLPISTILYTISGITGALVVPGQPTIPLVSPPSPNGHKPAVAELAPTAVKRFPPVSRSGGHIVPPAAE